MASPWHHLRINQPAFDVANGAEVLIEPLTIRRPKLRIQSGKRTTHGIKHGLAFGMPTNQLRVWLRGHAIAAAARLKIRKQP